MSDININSSVGKIGENIAFNYVLQGGFRVLFRNYREKHDEIDIITRHRDGTIVFFEVKTLFYRQFNDRKLSPEDNLTRKKFNKISRVCRNFAAKHTYLINEQKGWRIDLLAITLENGQEPQIRHYENI